MRVWYGIFVAVILLLFSFLLPSGIEASNSYVTVVNPLRSKGQIADAKNIDAFISMIQKEKIPTTLLLHYENLHDEAIVAKMKGLPQNQEIGLFLEVSERLATESFVPYLVGVGDYYRADKVLLSGYTLEDRKRLINTSFANFKKVFGRYPKSVGVWYIDAFSLSYLKQKYNISAALIVADQYKTDGYGLWGQPWGTPFVPTLLNSLAPSERISDGVVLLQWAARDPVRGYGSGVSDSTYSVQANDYIGHHNLDTSYFLHLAKSYLQGEPLGQLTIGLEIGQEGSEYLPELEKQIEEIKALKTERFAIFVTMSEFADIFTSKGRQNEPYYNFVSAQDYADTDTQAWWYTNGSYRVGILKTGQRVTIRDLRVYTNHPFPDLIGKDSSFPLSRVIPACIDGLFEKNELLLSGSASEVWMDDGKTNPILTIQDQHDGIRRVEFLADSIWIDEKNFKIGKTLSLRDNFSEAFFEIFVRSQLKSPVPFEGSIRFTTLADRHIFGITTSPQTLVGASSKFPFFGIFHFPFQVLTRFKTMPKISTSRYLLSKFIYWPNTCIPILLRSRFQSGAD